VIKNIPLVIIVLLLLLSCTPTEQVTEVIDGDTFRTSSGATVRLLGINAPEMTEPGGDIAKDMLIALVHGKKVSLKSDISDQDDYQRLLRYVYAGDIFVNAEMVRLGYAEARFYPPDTAKQAAIKSLEKIAVRNERGLWALGVFQIPDTSDEIVIRNREPAQNTNIISWQDAAQFYGQSKTVEGKIVVSNNTGKVCFLNFDKNWKKYFTAVIFASDFDKFPDHPEQYYLNRTVQVSGLIKEYQGKPEIILKSPAQITIVD
jgi:micrococcal nuclease